MLQFNYNKYDYGKVYDSIKQFYPIGFENDESRLHLSSRGLKDLEEIIVENIHHEKHFKERWTNFTEEIESETGKEILGTTYGQAPCYSSFILLEKNSLDNLTRTKELHFFVSLLGPYYTILGADNNTVKLDDGHYKSTTYLVTSPVNEFASSFYLLCDRIENRFTGYRFIPFELCKQTIEGLEVGYSDKKLNTVFHALFNDHIDLAIDRTIGSSFYKSEDWIKEGYVNEGEGWTSYPPSE